MALFKDMLKKWFYTTGTNPELTATSRVPVLDGSGNPVGSATIATMANFFSVPRNYATNITRNSNLDDLKTYGWYFCTGKDVAESLTNTPYTGGGFLLIVFSAYANTWSTQLLLSHIGIFFRHQTDSSGSEFSHTWRKINYTEIPV